MGQRTGPWSESMGGKGQAGLTKDSGEQAYYVPLTTFPQWTGRYWNHVDTVLARGVCGYPWRWLLRYPKDSFSGQGFSFLICLMDISALPLPGCRAGWSGWGHKVPTQ